MEMPPVRSDAFEPDLLSTKALPAGFRLKALALATITVNRPEVPSAFQARPAQREGEADAVDRGYTAPPVP
jgi:hypothetical protein